MSIFPTLAGEMVRELGQAKYLPTQLPAKPGALYDYAFNQTDGSRSSVRFVATSTKLFQEVAGAWVQQSLMMPATGLVSATPFSDYPQFCVINNLLHIADGVNNWIYDGPNNQFVVEGFIIPTNVPSNTPVGGGVITTLVSKYYWYTFADQTAGRVHESSSSPISVGIGAQANVKVTVAVTGGTLSTTLGSPNVTGAATVFTAAMVGQFLYVAGVNYGAIAAFVDSTHITLAANAPANNAGAQYLVCPPRTTHIHIYGSETDGSKLGKFHGSFAVTANPPSYTDNTPFQSDPTSTISNVDRPIRNDPPPGGKILEVHKYRIFRRRETKPNFFLFSGNEEISAGNGNGAPQESYPGAAGASTLSDMTDEASYPQEANRLRAIKSHADALWLGTEKGIVPLYGNSIDDFGLLQVVTVTGGVLSRWGMCSTPHGLTILGYDRLLRLYPPISPIYSMLPQNQNVTDQLIEFGRPIRKKLKSILNSDQDNVRTFHYQFGERDWFVLCYQDNANGGPQANGYHTYVYDFQTKAWWESQRGFVCVGTFEPTAGNVVLVGGAPDGFVYVMDDVSGTYSNPTCPAATFRTALIDFTRPDMLHVPDTLEFELSTVALAQDVTVNFYLDPQDADNLGTPYGPLNLAQIPGSASRWRATLSTAPGLAGVVCQRVMLEFQFAASINAGSLRGLLLRASPVSETLR